MIFERSLPTRLWDAATSHDVERGSRSATGNLLREAYYEIVNRDGMMDAFQIFLEERGLVDEFMAFIETENTDKFTDYFGWDEPTHDGIDPFEDADEMVDDEEFV